MKHNGNYYNTCHSYVLVHWLCYKYVTWSKINLLSCRNYFKALNTNSLFQSVKSLFQSVNSLFKGVNDPRACVQRTHDTLLTCRLAWVKHAVIAGQWTHPFPHMAKTTCQLDWYLQWNSCIVLESFTQSMCYKDTNDIYKTNMRPWVSGLKLLAICDCNCTNLLRAVPSAK